MRRFAASLVLLALAGGVLSAQFVVTPAPVKDGTRAIADLPASEHHRNVGGSDGAGLCVFTSSWHAAIWQGVNEVFGFRDWMRNHPGGAYPEKFAATLTQYCREKGVPVPAYVQHTGGDVEFLKLAIRTGRMPCVTYCGVDGSQSYGNEVIAHMVNLVHLDDERAAILDNNFPGRWLWMSAADFVARWKGVRSDGRAWYIGRTAVGGGWAVVWLNPPPAPYPVAPAAFQHCEAAAAPCICGDGCKCKPGECPNRCPVVQAPPVMVGQCPGGRCPLPAASGPTPIGNPPSDAHEWGVFEDGKTWGWRFKRATPANVAGAPLPPIQADPFPGGVVSDRINPETEFWVNGRKVKAFEAGAALGSTLADDSARWNLSAVGDAAFLSKFRSDLETLPADVRTKLHVQAYSPTGVGAWAVSQFKLAPGVTLRKPAVGRIGADIGTIPAGEYNAAKLAELVSSDGGPAPKPKPAPKVEPAPNDKEKDGDKKEPAPSGGGSLVLLAVAGVLLWLIFGKKAG